MKAEELELGNWILMPYGFEQVKFCVIERTKTAVKLVPPGWLVSNAIFIKIVHIEEKGFEYLGKGKKRWWRCFLPGFNDFIMPYV